MGITCEINLNKSADGVFIPGTNIMGVIKYAFDEETTIKKIIVSLKGSGCLQVRNKRGIRDNHRNLYRNNETYVDVDHVIQDDEKIFSIGLYEIKFNFLIPKKLPATFEYFRRLPYYDIRCIIGYYIRIKFERPGMFTFDKHFRKNITLVSGITPRYPTTPTVYGEQKNLSELSSLKTNLVNIKTNIESCIIPPGGKINLDYEVVNDSQVVVKAVEFKLVETYTFKPIYHPPIRTDQDVIDTDSKTSCIEVGETQRMHVVINVPIDKTSIEYSDILSRDYYVKMTVFLPMPHTNATIEIPIQIGDHYKGDCPEDKQHGQSAVTYNPNAPADNQYSPSAPPYNPGDSTDDQFSPSAPLSDNNYDDAPPSYWEVMGEHNEDGDHKQEV